MLHWRDIFNAAALRHETQARRLCEKLCNKAPTQPRLKTIAAVGAYDATIGGPGEDSRRLTAIMSYLLKSGFLIDPDFEIDIINFRQRRDFLTEERSADLVFVSFILSEKSAATHLYDAQLTDRAESSFDYRYIYGPALSARHDHGAWKERIKSCGAKIVATYGGQAEIGTHCLFEESADREFKILIPTPAHKTLGHVMIQKTDKAVGGYKMKTFRDLAFLYNGAANDLPLPWLGFAAARDYLRETASGLSPKTSLGQYGRAFATAP